MPPRSDLPALDPDPDRRLLRWGWLLWAAGCVVAAGYLLLAGRAAAQVLALVPLFAWLLLWPAWRLGRHGWEMLRGAGSADWHGAYYEFDGRQVRVLDDADDRLWFAVDDVLDVFGLAGRARDPARLRLIAGRDGVAPAPGTRLLCFSQRGLLAWLERRTEPRAAAFARWLELQVIRPHVRKIGLRRGAEPAQAAAGDGGHTAPRRS